MAQYDIYVIDILKVLKRIATSLDKIEKKMPDKPTIPNELREEIKMVIGEVADTDEQLVLMYRYIHNLTWANIADEMHADERTVRRWHNKALSHVIVPKIAFDD